MSKRHIVDDELSYEEILKRELMSQVNRLDETTFDKITLELKLQDACIYGNIEQITMLYQFSPNGITLHHILLSFNSGKSNDSCTVYLLTLSKSYRLMILNHAIRRNRVELVSKILDEFKDQDNKFASIFEFKNHTEYPLTIAAKYNNQEIIDTLNNYNKFTNYEHFFVYMCRHGVLDKVTNSWDKVSGNAKEHGLVEALENKRANIVEFILPKHNEFKTDYRYVSDFIGFNTDHACEYVCQISDSVDFIKKFSFDPDRVVHSINAAFEFNNYNVAKHLVDKFGLGLVDYRRLYTYWDGSEIGDYWVKFSKRHNGRYSILLDMLSGLACNRKFDTYNIFVSRYNAGVNDVNDLSAVNYTNNKILDFLVSKGLTLNSFDLEKAIIGDNTDVVLRISSDHPVYFVNIHLVLSLSNSDIFIHIYSLFSLELQKIIHDILLRSLFDSYINEDNMMFIAKYIFTLDELASIAYKLFRAKCYKVLAYLFKGCRLVEDNGSVDVYRTVGEEKEKVKDFNRHEHKIVYTEYKLQNNTITKNEYVYNTRYEFWFRIENGSIDFNDTANLMDYGVKIISTKSRKLEFYRMFSAYFLKRKGLPREMVDRIMTYISYVPGKQIDQL